MIQHIDDIDPWSLEALERLPNATAAPALTVEITEGVEPLDDQFGVHPPKTVPDVLYGPFFGQPAPTEAEIAQYGSAETVPPMKTYAILDAAKVFALVETLETSDLEHRCLFKGDAYDELKGVAPWVVRLEEGDKFTRRLFTVGKSPWYLWDKEPGIYVRSRGSLDDMWRHFRKFTRVQDENGKWYYFRFWESQLFRPLTDKIHMFPTHENAYTHILSGMNKLIVCSCDGRAVILSSVEERQGTQPKTIFPDMAEIRRLNLHKNMIAAADDIFTSGPSWVKTHYNTPRELSFLLRDFIDFCLETGIKNPDIRAQMLELIFAFDTPRWPTCLETKPFLSMRMNHAKSEDIAQDWIYRTQWQIETQSKGGS